MSRNPGLYIYVVAVLVLAGCAASRDIASKSQSLASNDNPYSEAIESLNYEALAPTWSSEQLNQQLMGVLSDKPEATRRDAATLLSLNAINLSDLESPALVAQKLDDYVEVMSSDHPALLGRVGDAGLLARLSQPLDYEPLLSATHVLEVLGDALSEGVITGYDLRQRGVYDNFPAGQTFIYSHSDLLHIRQLVTLLARENINAWVYLTPKISAFLYREEWGNSGSHVMTLPSGVRVVQGREMAVLFRFDESDDRARFQKVVNQYAKRDSKEEEGLITSAWWQPFYYTDAVLPEFQPISLVVAQAGNFEATLTVVKKKTETVAQAVINTGWQIRTDEVWVNPSFFRFLQGGYK